MKPNGFGGLFLVALVLVPVSLAAYYRAGDVRPSERVEPTRIIVKLQSDIAPHLVRSGRLAGATGVAALDAVGDRLGTTGYEELIPSRTRSGPPARLRNVIVINLPVGTDMDAALAEYNALDVVEYAEADHLLELLDAPDDALYSYQWGLHNIGQTYPEVLRVEGPYNDILIYPSGTPDADIDAHEAYLQTRDHTHTAIVAIIDTGVDWQHPDLADRIWSNPWEIPDNGIDDDLNGYIDDERGWDFSGKVLQIPPPVDGDKYPVDLVGHGTHCAGIVGAVGGNGAGIAGVSEHCLIMPVKIFPTALNSVAARAIVYAADNGADVISMSWGGPWTSQVLEDALEYARARGVVLVAASGNGGTEEALYPAAYPSVIAVSASNSSDQITTFSSVGDHLDLCAPGQSILSIRSASTDMYSRNDEPGIHIVSEHYYLASGTSMAAPFVAGVAAELRTLSPGLLPEAVRDILHRTADDITDPYGTGEYLVGWDKYSGHGRVNLEGTLANAPTEQAAIYAPHTNELVQGLVTVFGTAASDRSESYALEYGHGTEPSDWSTITSGAASITDGVLGTWATDSLNGQYMLRLRVGATHVARVAVFIANRTVASIDFPAPGDTIEAWTEIRGTANGVDFESYHVEFSEGWPGEPWHLIDERSSPVVAGRLATWSAGDRPEGTYALRLTVFSRDGSYAADSCPIYLRSPFASASAWKSPLHATGPALLANVGDFNDDDRPDIVIGTTSGIQFFDPVGGGVQPDMPDVSAVGACQTPVTVGDLDGDGRDDFVAVSDDGLLYGFPSSEQPFVASVPLPPLVAALRDMEGFNAPSLFLQDIDGDNRDEIHYYPGWSTSSSGNHYVFEASGTLQRTLVRGRFAPHDEFVAYLPADLDGDGQSELYLASSRLYRLSADGVVEDSVDLYIDSAAQPVAVNLSAVDIDQDGIHELIVLVTNQVTGGTFSLFAYDANLALRPGWPHDTGIPYYWTPSDPIFADIDRDSIPEYFITWFDFELGRLSGWRLDGTPLSGLSAHPVLASSSKPAKLRAPVAADFDGDGNIDLMASATEDIYLTYPVERLIAWDHEGQMLSGWPIITELNRPLAGSGWRYTTSIGDLDRDGRTDVLATTSENNLVFVNIDGAPFDPDRVPVPMWRYNHRLNGWAPRAHPFEIVAVSPTRIQPRVPLSTAIVLAFSRSIDPATLNAGTVHVTGSISGAHDGAIIYDDASRAVRFEPSRSFVRDEIVTVRLAQNIRSVDGTAMPRDFTTSFTVYAQIPEVTDVTPVATRSDIDFSTVITARFNIPLDPTSVSDSSVLVTAEYSGLHTGTTAYDANFRTIRFRPDTDFWPAERVTVELAASLRTSIGITMGTRYRWTFETRKPEIVAIGPTAHAVGVPRFSYVTARVDGDMPARTIHDSAIVVHSSVTGRIPGKVGYIPSTKTLRFTASGAYRLGDRIRVAVPFLQKVWDFTVTARPVSAGFRPPEIIAPGGTTGAVAAGDLNGDGHLDVCIPAGDAIRVLWNDGTGGWSADSVTGIGAIQELMAIDFDGDADMDLAAVDLAAGKVHILLNDGTGSFSLLHSFDAPGMQSVVASDFDGDGDFDLCFSKGHLETAPLWLNDGHGVFRAGRLPASLVPRPRVLAIDADGDLDVDLLVADSAHRLHAHPNHGNGTFGAGAQLEVFIRSERVLSRDFDSDGDLDLATLDARGTITVYFNDGTGGLTADFSVAVESSGEVFAAADLDGDGDEDLISIGEKADALHIAWNVGDGTFGSHTIHTIDDSITSVTAADFDSDGDMDLIAAGVRAVWLLVNDAASAVHEHEGPALPRAYKLEPNFPNPFNPVTKIEFAVPEPAQVRLDIFNVLGRRVVTLVDAPMQAGFHERTWDGRTADGAPAPSGIYFYRLRAGAFSATRKMIMLK